MPRGPGKRENYNLDYSRFNKFDLEGLDGLDEDESEPQKAAPVQGTKAQSAEKGKQGAGDPGEIPMEMFQHLPGELREAFRLMQISKQTGDEQAQKRANELAIAAIEKGGPEVKKKFEQEMMSQMAKHPEARKDMERTINSAMNSGSSSRGAGYPPTTNQKMEDTVSHMNALRESMEEGQKKAQKQMATLKKQQEDLEKLAQNGSPEDFFKFMHAQGLSEEDMQRAFSGDEKHMESVVKSLLEKTDGDADSPDPGMKKALEAVDQLHSGLVADEWEGDKPDEKPEPPKPEKKKIKSKPIPEAAIAEHRVQYQKDDTGRIVSVELRAELPGVESMAAIELDVSERNLRLRTQAPAFVVNAGPFPVLVDASGARAKFSKKKQELTLSVPAKS